ncbi:UbiA family prenyltransferase [Microcella sp.]|uniref:UbiA family prenyltransferase n=1 Tax=Microcella sp. TaxID=1913979 RepID=UPI00391BB887
MWPRLRTLLASSHPGPTVVVTAVSSGLAISVGLNPATTLLVIATVLANQLSIGWSNDAIDAARDREAGRRDKPVARDEVSSATLMGCAIVAASLAVALSLTLGVAAAIAHALLLASGWAYNLGLKRTLAATACYAVGFGALPSVITLAADPPSVAATWATGAGALLGIAAHFANVAPDRDDDRRQGMRAIPHLITPRASIGLAIGALATASALGVYGASRTEMVTVLSMIGSALTVACVVSAIVLLIRAPRSRWLFRVVMAAALATVTVLVGAGTLS